MFSKTFLLITNDSPSQRKSKGRKRVILARRKNIFEPYMASLSILMFYLFCHSLGYKLVPVEKNTSEIVFEGNVKFYANDGKWHYFHDSTLTKAEAVV